jgi:hypothetical protein
MTADYEDLHNQKFAESFRHPFEDLKLLFSQFGESVFL